MKNGLVVIFLALVLGVVAIVAIVVSRGFQGDIGGGTIHVETAPAR